MRCLKCGSSVLPPQKFCGECGLRVDDHDAAPPHAPANGYTPPHLAEKILRSRSALEGEHKQVTVLFCDIADSTPLAERIGAEHMHKVLNAFFGAALAQVHRYEGTINQFLGDGFMALFGAPVAHEDHARRAALAALAIRGAIDAAVVEFLGAGAPLQLRIGLNSGPVVVGKIGDNLRMDYTAVGDTTNVAARLQGLAEPGTILVSDGVARAIHAHVECRSLGLRQLKGKAEKFATHVVLRERDGHGAHHPRGAGGGVPTVGRAAEIGAIRGAIERVAAGVGGVLCIVGEAGLGKSRLVDEARAHAAARGAHWVEGQCVSFGRTLSYWPFREAIRAAFTIDETDADAAGFAKLERGLEGLFGAAADELLVYIAALLALPLPAPLATRIRALDGLAMGHQVSRATLRLFERLAASSPLVLTLEDWHWADASSADLLEHLLPLADRTALLFLVACRPDAPSAAESLRVAIASPERAAVRAHEMMLAPLGWNDSSQLAHALVDGGALPGPLLDMLLRRSGGNPFYLGELVHALLGAQVLTRDLLTGEWQAAEGWEAIPLPGTIEGLILARIDRLEDEVKQIVKAAAVVGRQFFYRILKAITDAEDALDADLATLCRAELIDEKRRTPELEYVFKHPLIQQAAYDSMVEDRRRQLHRQVGLSIETLFAGRLEPFHSMLAYHFAKAQEWPKAQHYLMRAAEHADSLAADEEALELYSAVIATAERESVASLAPLLRAQLDAKIGDAHFRAGRHEQALHQFELSLRRVGQRLPRSRVQLRVAVGLGLLRHMAARLWHRPTAPSAQPMPAADALGCEIWQNTALIHFFIDPTHCVYDSLQIANLSRDHPASPANLFSLSLIGMAFTALGFYRSADWCLDRAAELARLQAEPWLAGMVDHFRALYSYHVGEWATAVALADGAADCCWASGNIRLWSAVVGNGIMYSYSSGDPRWIADVGKFWAIVSETTDRQSQAWALSGVALVYEHRGEYANALATLHKADEIYAAIPDWRLLAHSSGVRCSSLLALGRIDEAAESSACALGLVWRHDLSGSWTTRPLLAAADLALLQFENAPAAQRSAAGAAAARAVRTMLRQGRRVRDEGAVESHRVAGTLAWIGGHAQRAHAHWERGLAQAEVLGARHARARLLAERGRRSGNRVDLELAAKLLLECDALGELRALQPQAAVAAAGAASGVPV